MNILELIGKIAVIKNNQVDVIVDLTQRLPFDDEYADKVVSFQVMEYLPEPSFFYRSAIAFLK